MQKARNRWIDYLRSFITVLVLAHHSALAYTTFGFFDATTYSNSTNPIVDSSRWVGMDMFVNFNDMFFMSLMFFISGLFVYRGLLKKGGKKFLIDRFKRLGIPFAVAVCLLMPVAYFPSYYLVNRNATPLSFLQDFIVHQQWPVGPPWFIWLLLLFNVIAVLIPKRIYPAVAKSIFSMAKHPFKFLWMAFLIVSLAYIPISLWVGQYTWTGIGPFDFQLNRILLYFAFFLIGACLGSGDWENELFPNKQLLQRSWVFWLGLCLLSYMLVELFTYSVWDLVRAGKLTASIAWMAFSILFANSCLFSSMALLSVCKENMHTEYKVLNHFSDSAFGIYLIHYIFITCSQFALLQVSLPAFVKFILVFLFTVSASWATTHLLRKLKPVRDII